MTTKLELQQINSRLATENSELRASNSQLKADNEFLRSKLADADHRTRKLIVQVNKPKHISEKREAMNAARQAAMKLGRTILVGDQHV